MVGVGGQLFFADDANLSSYLRGRGGGVAGDDFHLYPGVVAPADGGGNLLADGVADGKHLLEAAVHGEGQRAHGLPLIG